MNIFKGLGVALVTPFKSDTTIDYKALRQLVDYQIAEGADFICILATTGEAPTLSPEEKDRVRETVVKTVAHRVPVIMGMGGNCTIGVVHEMQHTNLAGIDGLLSVCPFYNKPTQEGLFFHFKTIADAAPLPIVLYNVPGRTGVNMEAETTVRLATACKNIVAIKEASGNLQQANQIMSTKPADFDILSGDDALTMPLMRNGATGAISVVGNALTAQTAKMISLIKQKQFDEAKTIDSSFANIYRLLFADGNPAGIKAMLSSMGLLENVLRLPLVKASETTISLIAQEVEKLRTTAV